MTGPLETASDLRQVHEHTHQALNDTKYDNEMERSACARLEARGL
jgi:hypothetical protein